MSIRWQDAMLTVLGPIRLLAYPLLLASILLIGAIARRIGMDSGVVGWATGATALLACFSFALVLVQALRSVRPIRQLVEQEHWLHWRYDQGEWAAANEAYGDLLHRGVGQKLVQWIVTYLKLLPLLLLIAGVYGYALLRLSLPLLGQLLGLTGVLWFTYIGLMWLASVLGMRYWFLGATVDDLYAGPAGIYHRLRFLPLGESIVVQEAELLPGTPTLLRLQPLVVGLGYKALEMTFPVPIGREQEAEQLIEKLLQERDRTDKGPSSPAT